MASSGQIGRRSRVNRKRPMSGEQMPPESTRTISRAIGAKAAR
jgi:hypothetical protein